MPTCPQCGEHYPRQTQHTCSAVQVKRERKVSAHLRQYMEFSDHDAELNNGDSSPRRSQRPRRTHGEAVVSDSSRSAPPLSSLPPPPIVPPMPPPDSQSHILNSDAFIPASAVHVCTPWLSMEDYRDLHVRPQFASRIEPLLRLQDEPHQGERELKIIPVSHRWLEREASLLGLQLDTVSRSRTHLALKLIDAIPLIDALVGVRWKERRSFYKHTPGPENCPRGGECIHEQALEVVGARLEMNCNTHSLVITLVVRQFGYLGLMRSK